MPRSRPRRLVQSELRYLLAYALQTFGFVDQDWNRSYSSCLTSINEKLDLLQDEILLRPESY